MVGHAPSKEAARDEIPALAARAARRPRPRPRRHRAGRSSSRRRPSGSPGTRSPATSGRRDIPTVDGLVNEDLYFLQARPRVELNVGPIELGVGGAFNYSENENDLPPEGLDRPLLIRENFRTHTRAWTSPTRR